MSLRTRLIISFILLVAISVTGGAIIINNLHSLLKNQEMYTFKDRIFHEHHRALVLIQSSQARLYRHQAGYSREIDPLVNDINDLGRLLRQIPVTYRGNVQPKYCNSCHVDVEEDIIHLEGLIADLGPKLRRYKEHISIIITSNDPEAQIVHHGHAHALGEGIIDTISRINRAAGLMVSELISSSEGLASESMFTISAAMAIVILISLAIMAYTLYALHHMISSLLQGTESIYRDDFSNRIEAGGRKDEFGLLASRFNLMAGHLEERELEIREKTTQLEEANTKLRDLNENLETKIQERTSELQETITRLQSATSALEESKRRVEETNVDLVKANQAKANFLSIVSHELKTPLSVINGFLSLILDERYQNDPGNLREAVEISKRRGQQLARMIDELIDLSRLDARAMSLHNEPVIIEDAFRDAAEQFQEDLQRKQIRLLTVDCSCLPKVTCDPDKIRQVITNLLSNAIKFSPDGSEIELSCRDEKDCFLFCCRDQGIGLSAEELGKVFEKFYQVDSSATRRYGGAGLGLSIVKEIIQLHGGRIWVESEDGRGCSFFFTLPKRPDIPVAAGDEVAALHRPGKTV